MADDLPRDYPWYAFVSGSSLAQGDILLDCPVFNLPQEAEAASVEEFTIRVDSADAIVMTQSCDLEIRPETGRCAAEDVLLCRVYFKGQLRESRTFGKDHSWQEAKQGRFVGYHILNRCDLPGADLDFMLVDFRRVHTLGVPLVRQFANSRGRRVRLLPPYREHLAQAFARFFMRVGLPVDIPDFKETRG